MKSNLSGIGSTCLNPLENGLTGSLPFPLFVIRELCRCWLLKKQGLVKNKFHDCSKDGSPQHKAAGCAQVGPNIGKFYALKKDQSDLVFGQGLTWYI